MRRFTNPASMLALIAACTLTYAGCAKGIVVGDDALVAAVVVTPASATIVANANTRLSATTVDEGGVVLSGRSITWETSAPTVATVDGGGLVHGVAAGQAIITARSGDRAGTSAITVQIPPVASVAVSPPVSTIMVNNTVQLSAALRDANGALLAGRAVTWQSSSTRIATVDASGLVTALAAGQATITATSEGKSGTATITVQLPSVASITVTPVSPSIGVSQAVQMVATLRDANGVELTGRTVTWETSAAAIATVSGSGLVTGVAAGQAVITARSEGQAGSTTATVQPQAPVPVATVAVSPAAPAILVNGTVQMSATMRDASGTVLTGRAVAWATSAPGVATVSASGLVTGAAPGSATITATSEGKSGTATVTVQVAPVATVAVSPSAPSIAVNATVQLAATLRDASGNVLTGRTVTWATAAASIATVSGTGLVTAVTAGQVTITATSEGRIGTAVVTVQAPAPTPVATVSVSPAAPTVAANATQQLTATTKDANGAVLTGRVVTWQSSATGVATVDGSGLVRGVAVGTATITATSEGKSGTATVTVSLPPVATVTVAPSTSSVVAGGTVQLTATTRDASGAVLTGRTVTWETSSPATATVSAGLVSGVAAGTATITARSEGQAGTASVTVTAAPAPNGNADPTLLPRATSQHPAAGTYGRSLAAGQTYVDPNTGVTVLKLTDASVPTANGGMYHGYSEGGPNISQAWTGTDGETYYTLKVGDWLVDVRYRTLTTVNWRRVNYWGEIGFAFSMNPATPRIAYTVNGKRVDRYNTATNAVENTGRWPWNIATAGDFPQWLQTQMNDTWFVVMLQSNTTVVGWRPSDGLERSMSPAQVGKAIDEPHLDREFPVVYIAGDNTLQNKMYNLVTGTYSVPNDPTGDVIDSHQAAMRGKTVAEGHWKCNCIMATGMDGRTWSVISPTPTDVTGDYHFAGQWVFNNPQEYFVVDQWAASGNNAIYRGMVGFVSMGGDVRLLAATDAVGTAYGTGGQPHPTLAQDGKLVMWTSNMNGSSRYDTFVARVPVK